MLFWLHLTAGAAAGAVIFVMAITGTVLAMKPQILAALERDVRAVAAPSDGRRLGAGALLERARAAAPNVQPTGITLQSDPQRAAAVQLGRAGTVYVDPYSGRIVGTDARRAQAFFRVVEDWHRWLGASGDARGGTRGVTGACNLAFLFLAISGPFLWLPRTWSWANIRAVFWFRRQRTGRARDFNWHNVIGVWCAPAIGVMTLTGVVMSYPWANAMLFRLAGSRPPAANGGPARQEPAAAGRPAATLDLDGVSQLAAARKPGWRSMTLRLPNRGSVVSASLVDGESWNQFARSTLTVDGATGSVVKWEPYEETSAGQRLRVMFRFAHTGELGGWPAQVLAGLASAGGAVLVWTGLSLALRRLSAGGSRSARPRSKAAASAVAPNREAGRLRS